MMRFENKVAIVTGAGSGIGRATALRLGNEGASVVVVDWNADTGAETLDMITNAGHDGIFLQRDVSSVADTKSIVAETVKRYGQLNVLVNNAGIIIEKNAVDTSEEDWDRLIGVNLKGAFFCAKHAILQFREQGKGGAIVNVASINTYYAEGGNRRVLHHQGRFGPAHPRPGDGSQRRGHPGERCVSGLDRDAAQQELSWQSVRTSAIRWGKCTPSGASASPKRWRRRWHTWPRTRRRSSPARCWPSMAASRRALRRRWEWFSRAVKAMG